MSEAISPVVPLYPRAAGIAAPVSPTELLKSILDQEIPTELIPGGVIVGSCTDAAIQAGCVSLMDAGQPRRERYLPLVSVRAQIRCLAPTLDHIDRIARGVYDRLDQRGRIVAVLRSTGEEYLIHRVNLEVGPSFHRDSAENWEALLFAEMLIGLDPVGS